VEVFKTELQLVVIQPFGAPTKLTALELLNDEPEAFDLRLRLSEVGALASVMPPIDGLSTRARSPGTFLIGWNSVFGPREKRAQNR